METKHTPGPWYWSSQYPIGENPTLTLVHTQTHLNGIICIRLEDNDHLPQPWAKSNDLRLIAAAPQLLEALEALLGASIYADAEGICPIENSDTVEGAAAVKLAKEAIALATGSEVAE